MYSCSIFGPITASMIGIWKKNQDIICVQKNDLTETVNFLIHT